MENSTEKNDNFIKHVPRNLITNALNFILNVIVRLLLVPYFISTLGIAAYAMIPLATSMTSYVNIIVQAVTTPVLRSVTIDLHLKDFEKINLTFNTALFGISCIISLIFPIVVLISYYFPLFINIPSNQVDFVRILFLGMFCAFLVRIWSGNFGVSLFAYNRLDLQNAIDAINTFVQVGLIVILFDLYSPNLIYIGLAYFIGSIVALIATVLISHKIAPHLKVNLKDFRLSKVKDIMGMGWWVVINEIGSLLFVQIDLILISKLFGAVAVGEYSIVFTWSLALQTISGVFVGILVPVILTYYAQENIEGLINLSKSVVKLMGAAIALPIGFLCGLAPQILSLWVGPEFVKLSPLTLLMLSHLVINLPVIPLFAINVAYNKVRLPGIVTFFLGIVNILLALILSSFIGWGYYGIAAAGAIMLTLKNALFTPWYVTKVLGVPSFTFLKPLISGVFFMLITALVSHIMVSYLQIFGLRSLAIYGIIFTVFYLFILWKFCLMQSDREAAALFMPLKLRSLLHL